MLHRWENRDPERTVSEAPQSREGLDPGLCPSSQAPGLVSHKHSRPCPELPGTLSDNRK